MIEGVSSAIHAAQEGLERHLAGIDQTARQIAESGPEVENLVQLRLDSIGVETQIAVLKSATDAQERLLDLFA